MEEYTTVCLFFVHLSFCLSVCLSVCLFARLSMCLSVCLFVHLSRCLSVCLFVCLFVCLSVCLSVCLFVVCHVFAMFCCSCFITLQFCSSSASALRNKTSNLRLGFGTFVDKTIDPYIDLAQ